MINNDFNRAEISTNVITGQQTHWLAPAKLNLFLHINGRREDGYHDLQTVFQFVDLYDDIRITVTRSAEIVLKHSLPGIADADNLLIKAARLLQKETACPFGAVIDIDKRIPAGGGLGGGSSNAATVLMALNRLWKTDLDRESLMRLGKSLGADVPVFVFGQNAWAEGIGEKLTALTLPEQHYLLLVPEVHSSTPLLFNHPDLTRNTTRLSLQTVKERMQDWLSFGAGNRQISGKTELSGSKTNKIIFKNDFTPVACQLYPEIKEAIAKASEIAGYFHSQHKITAKMTGTGAGVFVKIDPAQTAEILKLSKNLKKNRVFLIKSLSIHPHW